MCKNSILGILFLFLAGCAAQAPPGGGPEDKTAPEFISADPPNESVRIPVNQSLTFTFSETIRPASVRTSFTLFPLNSTETRMKIRRNRVTVSPDEHWDDDRVYTLVFNRSVQDLRGNNLEEAVSYTFTTGTKIPQGEISGQVPNYGKKDRILIGLAPGIWRPDSVFNHLSYLTETDKVGKYHFNAVPPGEYTISGIVDHDQSKTYSPVFDDLVLPDTLHTLMTDSTEIRIDLGIVRGNFVPMKYITGKNVFPSMTQLKFTKVLSPRTQSGSFIINDFPVDTFRIVEKDVWLYHGTIEDSTYRFHINLLADTLGVVAGPFSDTLNVTTFTDTLGRVLWQDNCLVLEPPVRLDTLAVTTLTPSDTLKRVMVSRIPGRFEPALNWRTNDFNGRIAVSVPVPVEYPSILRWTDTVSVRYKADSDSGRCILYVPDMKEASAGFILTGKPGRYEKTMSPPGTCIFENVFAGEYTLWYYPDRNGNGRQDHGWIWPYRPPEIARPLMKEIQIRARWDTEMNINFERE